MIKSPQDRIFTLVDGNVKTSGGSLQVANGQLAIVDNSSKPTQQGRKVLGSFTNIPKETSFQIKVGKPSVPVSRSTSDKDYETLPFKLSEIVDFKVFAPTKQGITVDDFIIGYNGKAGSELTLKDTSSSKIQVTLSGQAVNMLGYNNHETVLTLYLEHPYVDEDGFCAECAGGVFTMQEVVEKAVARFNKMTLLGGVPVTEFVEAIPVNSENTAIVGGTGYTFFNLTVTDGGSWSDLGRVQAQYPTFTVKRSNRLDDTKSVYTIIAPTGTVLANYTTNEKAVVKGCNVCPGGAGNELDAGFVYFIEAEDNGTPITTAVQGLPGAIAGTAAKLSQVQGVGYYSVVTTAALTPAQIATFITANPTATVQLVGDVKALCTVAGGTSTAWIAGSACTAVAKTFTITLPDGECGQSRLTELQNAYQGLTIAAGASDMCQTTYSTTVLSNIVCAECSDEFRALFVADAPHDFGITPWEAAAQVYTATAKMGIRFRAKEFVMSGSEEYRDDIPNIATSTRLRVAGGFPEFISESWESNYPFAVKVLSVASEPEGYGMHLRDYEDRARMYFDGDLRLEGNNFGKYIWGQETRLKGTAQYVDYVLTVDVKNHHQYIATQSEKIAYHFYVEVGRHNAVEDLLNKLVAAAGLPVAQAYGKV